MDLLKANYSNEHHEIADRLRSCLNLAGSLLDARMALGLSQGEVARLAGTTQSRVSEIEAMKGNPTRDVLDRIGRVVGLALDYVPRHPVAPTPPTGYREYNDVLHIEGKAESSEATTAYPDAGWSTWATPVATHG